jgi:hypothetical protein
LLPPVLATALMRPVKLALTWIKVLGLRRRTAKLGELGFDSREIGGNVLT